MHLHTGSRRVVLFCCSVLVRFNSKENSLVSPPDKSPTCLCLLAREVRRWRRVWTHCSSMTKRSIIKTTPCTEKATRKRPTPGSDMEK